METVVGLGGLEGGGGGGGGGEWVLLDGWLLAQQHYCWFRNAQETNFAPLYNGDDYDVVCTPMSCKNV